MSKPEDRPTTKALRLQTGAGLKRRLAKRIAGEDPIGARHNRREAEFMEQQAADILALPVLPEIGLGGEIVPGPQTVQATGEDRIRRDYMRDVAQDKPDAAAAYGSYERLRLAANAGAAELATEAAETIRAANAFERMLAHQLAVAHKAAMETMARAVHHNERADSFEYSGTWQAHAVESARATNAAARLMDAYQRGLLTLQRLRQGGQQTVTVVHQHVQVTDGAKAVVAGALATGGRPGNGGDDQK